MNIYIYISIYIDDLYTYKVWRKWKDTFDIPSIHPIHPSIPSVNSALRASLCKSALSPEGRLAIGECEYDFQNYNMYVCFKSELLDQKKEKENLPTCCNFVIFDQDPNLTSNFKTHKNTGYNFWLNLQLDIYMICIHTKYNENWRTLLITNSVTYSVTHFVTHSVTYSVTH